MATMFGMYPFLMKLYADGGYQGPLFRRAVAKIMARVNVEIVKRSDHAKGFVVLPKRWVVERTFAWLGRCRRLAKDWENLNRKALAFLRLASIRLMLRKLCNPAGVFCILVLLVLTACEFLSGAEAKNLHQNCGRTIPAGCAAASCVGGLRRRINALPR